MGGGGGLGILEAAGVQRSAFHVGEGIRFNHSQAERSSDWTGYAKLGRADAMGIVPDAPSHAVHGRALRRSPRAGRRTSVEVTRSAESVQSFFFPPSLIIGGGRGVRKCDWTTRN